jgi:uncharacterized protein YciI
MHPIVLGSSLLLTACCAAEPLSYTLVQLRTGGVTKLDPQQQQLFGGHFANMERMAKAGQLLVAGPYGSDKSASDLRGVFVLDTDQRARATAWAETDPAFQADVFRLEYHGLSTTAPLRELHRHEIDQLTARELAGDKPAPGDGIRCYFLLRAASGQEARRRLQGQPGVLLTADHDTTALWAVLDATSRERAEAIIAPLAGLSGEVVLDEWWASGSLAEIDSFR